MTTRGSALSTRETTHEIGLLTLRLSLGAVFLAHAWLKAAVFGFPGAASFFAAHGFPPWTVYPVFVLELVGGILLIAGFAVRATAGALAVIMVGALRAHFPNGWMFTANGGGWEYPAFLAAVLVVQAMLGAGRYSWRCLPGCKGRAEHVRP